MARKKKKLDTQVKESIIKSLSNDDALSLIGKIIDQAFDEKEVHLTTHALKLLDELEKRGLSSRQTVLLHYFRANAWENRIHEKGKKQAWDWDCEYLQNQIIQLRFAARHNAFKDLEGLRRCQIHTNLANKLSSIGRIIEAIEQWDKAIAIEANFAMALGNRAQGISAYAESLYDPGHHTILKVAASDSFRAAVSPDAIYDAPESATYRKHFEKAQRAVIKNINVEAVRKKRRSSDSGLGRSKAEQAYRTWVLQNRLFLNPLNDLGAIHVASHDVLTLPTITLPLSENDSSMPPSVIGFFNQLKQEFVSARFLFFEGTVDPKAHFSDGSVLLFNTLDYPSYAFAVEKTRLAYRSAYSLFDKIAYFLNEYLNVGYPPDRVNFRNIWYEHKGADSKTMRTLFVNRQNWPLRGLYWLSKDLFDSNFKQATEPEAEALAEIRNFLEHKYLQVHESWGLVAVGDEQFRKGSGFHLQRDEFEAKTLRVLKLARAALIYLSLSVHREEYMHNQDSLDAITGPMLLDAWRDNWKI